MYVTCTCGKLVAPRRWVGCDMKMLKGRGKADEPLSVYLKRR